ncbi:MAG: GlsB/YeaQ/YmgE family stress response membrane protein [Planctomycetes bacterium]|nr:GlsB/YeaQ/YmgE family stress response membrane protein [Planctomycetota bacterium]
MGILELLLLLLIAGICGAIGQSIAGFSRGGFVISIVLGFLGAMLGGWLARRLGLPEPLVITIDQTSFPVLWSILGSALFVALIAMLTRPGRKS